MTEGPPDYPFVLPDHRLRPNSPLCPWKPDNLVDHELYYCPVGGHQDAYARFTRQVPRPLELCRSGGVIVVGGPERCGKSSLINRCLNWVQQGVATEKGIEMHAVNLADIPIAVPSVDERIAEVATLIRYKTLQITKEPWLQRRLMDETRPSIEAIMSMLNAMWESAPKHAFLVVPPPLVPDRVQARQEIDRYRGCVEPGVVCLLEHTTGQHPQSLPITGTKPLIQLGLRNLQSGEAMQLLTEWPDTSTVSPPILEGVMAKFERCFMNGPVCELSVGVLLATIREVYQRRMDGMSDFGQVESIELEELIWAWRQVVISQSSGQGSLPS